VEIALQHIGKKFGREWIFRDVTFQFHHAERCAILGGNGSGKSTLLQIVSGYLSSSEGKITWKNHSGEIAFEALFPKVTLCTPMMSLYDDLTLEEHVRLWCKFRNLKDTLNTDGFAECVDLYTHRNKKLRHFSSGMRQRVKLGLAILSESEMLLLDEPVSHLDSRAMDWFQRILSEHLGDRSLFVASNSHSAEISLCTSNLNIQEFKSSRQAS
jgi:ABC-type multidrug transport system ATPase subunit